MRYSETAENTRLVARRGGLDEGELSKSTDEAMVTEAMAKRRQITNAKIGNLCNAAADMRRELLEALTCPLVLYTAQDAIAIISAVPPMTRIACESDIT
jgi:hypothetical protein